MSVRKSSRRRIPYLKAGECVEVLSLDEILETLDEHGRLDNLAFMPEMLPLCGQKLRVYKRADKTCDPANAPWTIRRLKHTVHLEDVRCDGAGHGGCEAGCLLFWHEAWLKRADSAVVSAESLAPRAAVSPAANRLCTVESILAASQSKSPAGEVVYSCQATEIRNYTFYMKWWDPRQYFRDIRSGNLIPGLARDVHSERFLEWMFGFLQLFKAALLDFVNYYSGRVLHEPQYPFVGGSLDKTPIETLGLQAGELVEVRSKTEIVATLDKNQRNRGLHFDSEMVPYCGGIYRVSRRVKNIIDEKTGKMLNMKYPCIVLEGVICKSDYHRLCPRAIFAYWRENWLKRAVAKPASECPEQSMETCERS